MMPSFRIRAPGRICLFGEHQDYLGFPVIAAAIDRYIFIDAIQTKVDSSETRFRIQLPDLKDNNQLEFIVPPNEKMIPYSNKRDYLPSGINVARKNRLSWQGLWDVKITGNIPINAGASSSSALVIAWLRFLWAAANLPVNPQELGTLGYQTEVAEFGEAGGMMDHFASAVGKLIMVESIPQFKATPLPAPLEGFVLANSGVKKDTVEDLRRVKTTALQGFVHLKEIYPQFDRFKTLLPEVEPYLSSLTPAEAKNVRGNLRNRDITREALLLLQSNTPPNPVSLGALMNDHQQMLSKNVGISHPTVDKMVTIALNAGAKGAKINGSGFGGTMWAYAPGTQAEVVKALTDAGFNAWPVRISEGAGLY
jgi:galactokinase